MSVLSIVAPDDLQSASTRIFKGTLAAATARLDQAFPQSACSDLAAVPQQLSSRIIRDAPEVRAWIHSISHVARAFCEDHWELLTEAIHHIRLDSCDASRIAELLRFQGLGILIGDALAEGRNMQFQTSIDGPPYLAIPKIGRFDLPDCGRGLRVVVSERTVNLTINGLSVTVSDSGELLTNSARISFSPAVRFSMLGEIREIPIHDPALFQPAFQSHIQVAGFSAATALGIKIAQAAEWLERLDLPNYRDILRWCNSFIGLATLDSRFGSGSRVETLGLIYLPSRVRLHELAESLLHEALHQHLFRLDSVAPLFEQESDARELYYSPWRTDPRPLLMNLHGAYVFTGVAEMYSRCIQVAELGVNSEEAKTAVYRRTRQAIDSSRTVQKYAILTPIGRRVIAQTLAHANCLIDKLTLPHERRKAIEDDLATHRMAHCTYLD